MTYRKKAINYRGVEPAPTSTHQRIVCISYETGSVREWQTVISCDKCRGYFSCVFRGRPCFMPRLIQNVVRPAVVTTRTNEIDICLPANGHHQVTTFARIVEQVIRDKKR